MGNLKITLVRSTIKSKKKSKSYDRSSWFEKNRQFRNPEGQSTNSGND
jgi:hypothetical protein